MTGKGPLNYTTSIGPGKTASECIDILVRHGARKVGMSVGEDRVPDGIEFIVDTPYGPRQYALDVNAAGTQKALERAWSEGRIAPRFTEPEQARRVAWRVLKDWLEAQMAMIEAGLADLPKVMLPYMRTAIDRTAYDDWAEHARLELEAAQDSRLEAGSHEQ